MSATGRDHGEPAPYISFDREVDAGYIRLTDQPIAETRQVHPAVLLDLSADGELIGIELLSEAFADLGEHIMEQLADRSGSDQ